MSKVNLSFVDGRTGRVLVNGIRSLGGWNPLYSMETILADIRRFVGFDDGIAHVLHAREMASGSNKKAVQPAEGSIF